LAEPDIFLSYNREDAEVARRFAEGFEAQGFDVWWDQALRSGEAYDEVTEAALRNAKAVVVLWSKKSVVSRWVRAEATLADRNRTFVPARIEACDLPIMFELTQTAELSHWRGDGQDKAWQAFVGDVGRMVGKDAPATAPKPSPPPVEGGIPVVAMLPIACRGGGDELEFLAEDLTEEVTRELGQSPFFKVIAASARSGSQSLSADYILEAKLQRNGETLRLTAQLIDAASGSMLYSTRLAHEEAGDDSASEEFAGTIASNLGVLILQVAMNRAVAKQGDLTGWDHIFRSRAATQAHSRENSRIFVEEARQAVAALPDLDLPHAMLAGALGGNVSAGRLELDGKLTREIQTHVRRATQFGVNNPVLIGYLMVAYQGLGDGEACLRLARRAVELSPHSPRAHYLVGSALAMLGRTNEAIVIFESLEGLAPTDDARLSTYTTLGPCYLLQGRLTEADATLDKALAIQADSHVALKWKAIIASNLGNESAALSNIRRLRSAEPEMTLASLVAQITHYSGTAENMAEPIATLRRLWEATEGDA